MLGNLGWRGDERLVVTRFGRRRGPGGALGCQWRGSRTTAAVDAVSLIQFSPSVPLGPEKCSWTHRAAQSGSAWRDGWLSVRRGPGGLTCSTFLRASRAILRAIGPGRTLYPPLQAIKFGNLPTRRSIMSLWCGIAWRSGRNALDREPAALPSAPSSLILAQGIEANLARRSGESANPDHGEKRHPKSVNARDRSAGGRGVVEMGYRNLIQWKVRHQDDRFASS